MAWAETTNAHKSCNHEKGGIIVNDDTCLARFSLSGSVNLHGSDLHYIDYPIKKEKRKIWRVRVIAPTMNCVVARTPATAK